MITLPEAGFKACLRQHEKPAQVQEDLCAGFLPFLRRFTFVSAQVYFDTQGGFPRAIISLPKYIVFTEQTKFLWDVLVRYYISFSPHACNKYFY